MRLLVTGGAGFIGGHAEKHFSSCGDDVLIVDKLTYAAKKESKDLPNLLNLDVCDTSRLLNVVEEFSPDFIVHFAAETHVDNSIENCRDFVKSNIEGVASVLDVCKEKNIRLCHISTDEVYGPALDRPFLENDNLNPMNPYAATKAAGDMLVKSYRNTYGIEYLIVRPSNNYGPKQHHEKFIPKLLKCLDEGKNFPLYGSGDQIREWTFVEDTSHIIRKLLDSPAVKWNETYNLSSGIFYSNLETADKIVRIYNRIKKTELRTDDVIKSVKDRPGHDRRYWISAKKLDSFVKYEYTGFQLGLEKTVLDHVQ